MPVADQRKQGEWRALQDSITLAVSERTAA